MNQTLKLPRRIASHIHKIKEDYYLEAKTARDINRKAAWTVGTFPVELVYAMDVLPIYPENTAA